MRSRLRYVVTCVMITVFATTLAPAVSGEIPSPDPAVYGAWSGPHDWPLDPLHGVLLPTGKVLVWGSVNRAYLWSPRTKSMESVPYYNMPYGTTTECAGHTVLPSGKVLVAGGATISGTHGPGHPYTAFFDPFTKKWIDGPDMTASRYYPSALTLPDGRALVVSGLDHNDQRVDYAETLQPGRTWKLGGWSGPMQFYPMLHVLPDGRVVRVGSEAQTRFLDPDTGKWRVGPLASFGPREGGSSVLLPGLEKVLVAGGGPASSGVPTAEVLDTRTKPRWRQVDPMRFARRELNLVLLADGSVLAVGGAATQFGPGVLTPERFDPKTEKWSVMAAGMRGRTYHSFALLLPDARVLVAGGFVEGAPLGASPATQDTGEVFSPPYLFRGSRPKITSAPRSLGYADAATVRYTSKSKIARVALVRLGSATHAVNFDQRYVDLRFRTTGDGLRIEAPSRRTKAPPGWYMLFLVNSRGVPSVASMVKLA